LLKRASEFNILLEDVSITHLSFGQDFTAAVEQKVIAQQEAERAKFVVEKAEQEKMAGIIRAEGESTAASLLSTAYQKSGQAHLELRRIEAAKDIAATLGNSRNVTYLPGGGPNGGSGGNYLLKVD
jgi:prohibitin 1